MRTWEKILEDGAGAGKLTVRETRRLAQAAIEQRKEIARLRERVEELLGGKAVEWKEADLKEQGFSVNEYPGKGADGQWAGAVSRDTIELMTAGRVFIHAGMGYNHVIVGPEREIQRFLKLRRAVNEALLQAYNSGLEAGMSVLLRMAEGHDGPARYDGIKAALRQN